MAVVGVGRMGAPICARLAGAGHEVAAFDLRPEQVDALGGGVRRAGSAADAATGADVLLTVLPGPEEVGAALDDEVFAAMAPGALWLDLSSNTPAGSAPLRALAGAHGVQVLEAPMGGGPEEAARGRLRLFAAGDADLLDAHRPLLEQLADRIVHTGGPGTGYTAKLLVNLLWFGQAAATAEALLLGTRAGIALDTLHAVLADSAAGSDFIRRDLPALYDGDYLASYAIDRVHRQLAALTAMARDLGTPHEVSEAVRGLYEQTVARFGPADGELLAVALLEERAGTQLRTTL
jgi:3-hydroxyisobutyrate dehydrogenase